MSSPEIRRTTRTVEDVQVIHPTHVIEIHNSEEHGFYGFAYERDDDVGERINDEVEPDISGDYDTEQEAIDAACEYNPEKGWPDEDPEDDEE